MDARTTMRKTARDAVGSGAPCTDDPLRAAPAAVARERPGPAPGRADGVRAADVREAEVRGAEARADEARGEEARGDGIREGVWAPPAVGVAAGRREGR